MTRSAHHSSRATDHIAGRAIGRLPLLALLALAIGALLAAPSAAQEKAGDWLQFRGPGGNGVSGDKNLPETWDGTKNIAWKVELPGSGTSSPIIMGERIYLTWYNGYAVPRQPKGQMEDLKLGLLCLNKADGKPIWSKEVPASLPEQESIRESHGYASSTPTADAERVYAFFGRSGVVAMDHEGKQLWKVDVGSKVNGWGSAASPILYEGLLIVNASVESSTMVGLDKKTGKEVWRAEGINEAWNTPLLVDVAGGKKELVISIPQKVFGFDPATGQKLWTCSTGIGWYMAPSMVAHDGVIYCLGGRQGGCLAVKAGGRGEVTASHRVWMGKKGSNVASPVVYQGHLFWMNDVNETAYCADLKTGELLYEEKISRAGQVYASSVAGDGKIYHFTRSGRGIVLAAKPKFEQIASNSFGDRATYNASPAISGGKIYLRSDKHLYCISGK